MDKFVLSAKGITKRFPGVKALDNVDFDLLPGEVHILVGENGAGKSSLAKCLLGAYIPEEGQIYFEGKEVQYQSAKDALKDGIAAVYQEFTLIPWLNVAQNIYLNREPRNLLGLLDHKKMRFDAQEILSTLGCSYIDVSSPIKYLSVAEQQMVEIAKALSFQPKVLVFDEPTATLSEREVEALFAQIIKLKSTGIGIIYVSHRMQEFPLIGDRITVLRDGKKIATVGINDCSGEQLVNMMVGRDVEQTYVRTINKPGDIALEANGLHDDMGRVNDVSIRLMRGEIVGLAGLVGSGRTETANLLFGINKATAGTVSINGQLTQPKSPVQMVNYQLGLVPEDRKANGLSLRDSVAWNILTVSLRLYFKGFFVNYRRVMDIAEDFKSRLRIATPSVEQTCKLLSGGNQQKTVLAKWLSTEPEILIFDEPTRGIDVGAKLEIYALMDQLAGEGKAILMISSELPEVVGLSDRIYVMREGTVVEECVRGDKGFDVEEIGKMMLGLGEVS